MKKSLLKMTAFIIIIACLCAVMAGCAVAKGIIGRIFHVADGPDMEYKGRLLDDALAKAWVNDDGRYKLTFSSDSRFCLELNGQTLISYENGGYGHSFNGDELTGRQDIVCDVHDITLNGEPYAQLKGFWYEDGAVYMALELASGENEFICFREDIFMLDGGGMAYEGLLMDEALAGTWRTQDGRYVIVNDSMGSNFSVDGTVVRNIEKSAFFYHDFKVSLNSLDERNNLDPAMGKQITDEKGETLLIINEAWYESGNVYMNIAFADGSGEELVFTKDE